MTVNFEIELDGVNFRFLTMNRVRLQLYQVYVPYEGWERRFHVQSGDDGVFRIMGEEVSPKEYVHLENTFNDAIYQLGQPN